MRKHRYIFLLLTLFSYSAISQTVDKDFQLIKSSHSLTIASPIAAESFYSKTIQKQLAKTCVYEMKCREFTKGVFREFGPIKGIFLAIDRAGRCTHISTLETLPSRLNKEGKIIEKPADYRLHQ